MSIQNDPLLWKAHLPAPKPHGHKYGRGVAVIWGAPKMTGATRLAARACARMGAGLVKVVAPAGTGEIYRSALHEEIVVEDAADFAGFDDQRIRAVLIGSGCRPADVPPDVIGQAASHNSICLVLDAGAISAWQGKAGGPSHVVLTPHDGEFQQKFGLADRPRLAGVLEASKAVAAMIVLKGAQTIIAGAGEPIVQDRDVPALSTAGTGDVLAGMIAGLLAQGMDMRWACAAAVWIHAEAAVRFGPGMVASDLPEMIPDVLRSL